jgi:hypothetical protein
LPEARQIDSSMVYGVGEEDRARDRQAGLFPDFPVQRFFDGLAILDSTPEPGPAARVGDPSVVVTVMQEQPAARHDQQHRRAAPWLVFRL